LAVDRDLQNSWEHDRFALHGLLLWLWYCFQSVVNCSHLWHVLVHVTVGSLRNCLDSKPGHIILSLSAFSCARVASSDPLRPFETSSGPNVFLVFSKQWAVTEGRITIEGRNILLMLAPNKPYIEKIKREEAKAGKVVEDESSDDEDEGQGEAADSDDEEEDVDGADGDGDRGVAASNGAAVQSESATASVQ
jgi:hypothetical protein